MSEARRLEQQGEIIEAIWCYDTVLKDPLVSRDPATLQAAGLGLAQLLIAESRLSDESQRTGRLLNRAIQALILTHRSNPDDPHLALSLAEAHGERYRHTHQPADVLAVNLLLDRMGPADDLTDRIATLRSIIAERPSPRQNQR